MAERSAKVAAVGDRNHPQGKRYRPAPRAAPGRLAGVEGVPCRSEERIVRVRAQCELRHVGLADKDGPGIAHPAHHQRVGGGYVVLQDRRTLREPDSLGRGGVLHRVRKAMQRAKSEEHTSELQSLMRISYAVFCLK